MAVRISNNDGVTLGELRQLIEDCKYLPNNTPLIFDDGDIGLSTIKDIQGDYNSITFFGFLLETS